MRMLGPALLAAMLATGTAQASSILSMAQTTPEQGGSMIALESDAARHASNKTPPLSYPTPSLETAPHAEPFRLTRSMTAAGEPLPEAPVATDEVTGAVATKPRRGFNLPPVLIRAGVRSEPAMHAIAPPRKPLKAKEAETEGEEEETPSPPAQKPGVPR